ncbi:hypothetical protein L6164_016974 [Bauhinia variegata]|uniref:Uncharacterized protein n=1 Tax=Bauhinia variegata TaxID=167791 RepID=A0ACB9N6M0_BAUVA|nr:hypothetical protein L6164_016974 [Bauhinia variegata]
MLVSMIAKFCILEHSVDKPHADVLGSFAKGKVEIFYKLPKCDFVDTPYMPVYVLFYHEWGGNLGDDVVFHCHIVLLEMVETILIYVLLEMKSTTLIVLLGQYRWQCSSEKW